MSNYDCTLSFIQEFFFLCKDFKIFRWGARN